MVNAIKRLARLTGYADCGIASANDFKQFENAIEQRIRRFPEAGDMYRQMISRARPRARTEWARSIVVCIRRYGKYEIPAGLSGHIGRTYLFDRRFPDCPDHYMPRKMKQGLKQMGLRVRQGGIPDRWAGARSGTTRFGANCFAYSRHGSWINIETWLVDADLPPDKPTLEPACPPNCRACIDACPTGALVEPFIMRMDRCVAHLTYSAPEPISKELSDRMGEWIYGCDRCQEVCPLNRNAWEHIEKAPWLEEIADHLQPEALAAMDQKTFQNIIHPRFWYIPITDIARWRTNARRALACSGH